MRTIIFATFLLLQSVALTGQFTFAPLGAKWYFINESCDPTNNTFFTYEYEVKEDSIILGKYCTQVSGGVCPGFPSCEQEYFSYQEGDKVYLYDNILNDFQILYDFGLQTGESYKIRVCKDLWDVDSIIVTINSILPGIVDCQEVTVAPNESNSWSPYNAKVYKGIGSTGENPLLFSNRCITIGEPCFITNITCYETPEAGIFQIYGEKCAPSASIETSIQPKLSVFPNPSNGIINLHLLNAVFIPSKWLLFDLTGNLIVQMSIGDGQNMATLNVENLADGMYFWQVVSEDRQLGSGKLIIAK